MLENEKIEDEIKSNPEKLEEFNRNHGDVLLELRARFLRFIADGDLMGRYLMSKTLLEKVEIQAQVAKQHIEQKPREKGLNIVDIEGKKKH
jgi:hypothetical protein